MQALMSAAFITGAGVCFMLANLAMKTMGDTPIYILYPAIAATFAAGAYFEIEPLKHAPLGYAVTFILAWELVLSLLIAILFFKESYSSGNLLGIGLVVIGVALLHLPSGQSLAQMNAQAQSDARR
jgi:multidrug transporter EmrE-like cation transporter